ncbi:hypothetical protein [Tardiphaga sp. 841_E9_N1_2]|uniref:hypothetical protein n=1 Tax=Tardiphaga sp. 841_E9_N1_2 TaxID=3240762 RepID=UPI003F26E908
MNAPLVPPRWISLREALEHVVAYRHSSKLAQTALRDALAAGKIASLAASYRAVPYHYVPHSPFELKSFWPPPVPVARQNYEIEPALWEQLTIVWHESAASRNQEMKPKEYGRWGESEKRLAARAVLHPTIDMSGIVVSEAHIFEIWPRLVIDEGANAPKALPSQTEQVGRRKGTGLYYVADTKTLKEVIEMIDAGAAVSCDGAVNEILRRDPSRLVGKSDDGMRRRIRDRYRLYRRSAAL